MEIFVSKFINALEYDETGALRRAFEFAKNNSGRVTRVTVDPALCRISSPIQIETSNLEVFIPASSTVQARDEFDVAQLSGSMFFVGADDELAGYSNVVFRGGGKLDGNNSALRAVYFAGPHVRCGVDGLVVTGTRGTACLKISAATNVNAAGGTGEYADWCFFTDNIVDDVHEGLEFTYATNWKNEGNSVETSDDYTVEFGTDDVDPDEDTITLEGHSFNTGHPVSVTSTDTVPGGIGAAQRYVIRIDGDTIQLTDAVGNDPINITSVGAGTHTIGRYPQECLESANTENGLVTDNLCVKRGTTNSCFNAFDRTISLSVTNNVFVGVGTPVAGVEIDCDDRHVSGINISGNSIRGAFSAGVSLKKRDYSETFAAGDVDTSEDTITLENHDLMDDDLVYFVAGGSIFGGVTEYEPYFVRKVDDDTFQLTEFIGDDAVSLTSQGSGTHSVFRFNPGIVIASNTIGPFSSGEISGSGMLISNDCLIVGNYLFGCHTYGIQVGQFDSTLKGVAIKSNTFVGAGIQAVQVNNAAENGSPTTIVGNDFATFAGKPDYHINAKSNPVTLANNEYIDDARVNNELNVPT